MKINFWALLAIFSTQPPGPAPEADFVMRPAADFADPRAPFSIIGGTKADLAEWPATFIFSSQGKSCTSTAVGSNVILTAAHCVPDGGKGILEQGGQSYSLRCLHHPNYRAEANYDDPQASPDFALCRVEGALSGIEFEHLLTSPEQLTQQRKVHLLGFGCNVTGGSDGGFGVLYEGDSWIESVPRPPSYFTVVRGGAAVCYGDSGGGAFLYLRDRTVRLLFGVNSLGDIKERSWLATTSLSGFLEWARNWSRQNGGKICGLHNDASGCRVQ